MRHDQSVSITERRALGEPQKAGDFRSKKAWKSMIARLEIFRATTNSKMSTKTATPKLIEALKMATKGFDER
jgi:hypothetical protein